MLIKKDQSTTSQKSQRMNILKLKKLKAYLYQEESSQRNWRKQVSHRKKLRFIHQLNDLLMRIKGMEKIYYWVILRILLWGIDRTRQRYLHLDRDTRRYSPFRRNRKCLIMTNNLIKMRMNTKPDKGNSKNNMKVKLL